MRYLGSQTNEKDIVTQDQLRAINKNSTKNDILFLSTSWLGQGVTLQNYLGLTDVDEIVQELTKYTTIFYSQSDYNTYNEYFQATPTDKLIIEKVRSHGIKVILSYDNFNDFTYNTCVSDAVYCGVDGINVVSGFSLSTGVTRQTQNTIIDYVHQNSLSFFLGEDNIIADIITNEQQVIDIAKQYFVNLISINDESASDYSYGMVYAYFDMYVREALVDNNPDFIPIHLKEGDGVVVQFPVGNNTMAGFYSMSSYSGGIGLFGINFIRQILKGFPLKLNFYCYAQLMSLNGSNNSKENDVDGPTDLDDILYPGVSGYLQQKDILNFIAACAWVFDIDALSVTRLKYNKTTNPTAGNIFAIDLPIVPINVYNQNVYDEPVIDVNSFSIFRKFTDDYAITISSVTDDGYDFDTWYKILDTSITNDADSSLFDTFVGQTVKIISSDRVIKDVDAKKQLTNSDTPITQPQVDTSKENYSSYRTARDDWGIYTVVTLKRKDGTIYKVSTLYDGQAPEYTYLKEEIYDSVGTTVISTTIWKMFYDDGEVVATVLYSIDGTVLDSYAEVVISPPQVQFNDGVSDEIIVTTTTTQAPTLVLTP